MTNGSVLAVDRVMARLDPICLEDARPQAAGLACHEPKDFLDFRVVDRRPGKKRAGAGQERVNGRMCGRRMAYRKQRMFSSR